MIDLEIIKDAVEKNSVIMIWVKAGGWKVFLNIKKSLGTVELPFVAGRLIK